MPLYFAYGSNLHPVRLARRAPSAGVLGRAYLRGHRLAFHKRGRDGSGKCDASFTGRRADLVQGVVYRIAHRDWRDLDRAEDLGRGYDRVRVSVSVGARRRMVLAYVARPEAIAPGLAAFDWYLGYVLGGARHHRLPGRYVRAIAAHAVRRDPVAGRRLRNRGLMGRRGARPSRRR